MDQLSMGRDSYHFSDEEPEDFGAIGREIMEKVKGPANCRMGDIYHKIKATVDKMAYDMNSKKLARMPIDHSNKV